MRRVVVFNQVTPTLKRTKTRAFGDGNVLLCCEPAA